MNSNDSFDSPPEQLALSYELLYLLRWIIEHEYDALEQLIAQAARNRRLYDHTDSHKESQQTPDEDLQEAILEFLALMDDILLAPEHNNTQLNKTVQQDLIPSLQQIDSSACDDVTVLMSLDQTTAKLDAQPGQDAKKVLFEELLRRWEPDEKTLAN